jgi:hypothetical protein
MPEEKTPKAGRRLDAGGPPGRSSSHGGGRKVNRGRTQPPEAVPEISVAQQPLDRETLAELQEELRSAPWPRAPFSTVSYHEVPLDSGQARAGPTPVTPRLGPPRPRRRRDGSAPTLQMGVADPSEPSVTAPTVAAGPGPSKRPAVVRPPAAAERAPAGPRAVDAAACAGDAPTERGGAEPATATDAPAAEARPTGGVRAAALTTLRSAPGGLVAPRSALFDATAASTDALELRTFAVPEAALAGRASDEERLAFVRGRFGARLPCSSRGVRRVDVSDFEPGAVLLLVWCQIDR